MHELLDLDRATARRPGAASPVMPAFLGEQPNTRAFSRPDGTNAAGQYQVRVWSTPFATPTGERVWVAAASYDRGMALAPTTLLPTRSIAPEIDAARDYVVRNLQASGMAGKTAAFPLGPLPRGEEDGSPFVTDGRAVILWLQPVHR